MNLSIERYSDDYGPRIGLKYPYDTNANSMAKTQLGFPAFKWDAPRKVWSIQATPEVVSKAIDIFRKAGYDFSELLGEVKVDNPCRVEPKGSDLKMWWPFIPDAELRDEVRLAVKSIDGRKWNQEDKSWSIPLVQATSLYTILKTIYPSLADAINDCPEVSQEVSDSLQRVALSQAATLDDDKVAEMQGRLDSVLPAGQSLYPFQQVGVAFTEMAGGRALIGDEMGLGKTIISLAYMALHPELRPCLVVAPANVKYNWANEIGAWLPDTSIHIINKGSEDILTSDFVIVNFDLMAKQKERLNALNFKAIIIDESHYLQNSKAQRTQATLSIAETCDSVLALSGTAISSRPKEFFTTLNLLRSDHFPSFFTFAKRYCEAWHNGFGWDFSGASNTKELNERTRDFCVRRLKSEVLKELPDKQRTFLPVNLSKKNRDEYDQAADDWGHEYDTHVNFGSLPQGFVLNMLTDLRHICGRLKVDAAISWIKEYLASTDKPLVAFCHHKDVLSSLKESLQEDDIHTCSISGDTSSKERARLIAAFQEGHIKVLVCNTIAAKEGITLTKADTVLFLEREWVPSWEEQAEDRVHRIGQDSSSVHAVYLSCINTIDEHFDRVVESKREVVKAVLDGGDAGKRSTLLKDLLKRLQADGGWVNAPVDDSQFEVINP